MRLTLFEEDKYKLGIANSLSNLIPTITQFLLRLVAEPSIRGNEGGAADVIRGMLSELKLSWVEVPCREDGSGVNFAVRIKGSEPDRFKSIVLNAHYDVTPVDAPGRWTSLPFTPVIKEGMLFGRGSLDDKAGVAVILLVANVILQQKINLPGDLILQFVVEDETSGDGSLALVQNGFGGDGVIICDGTWPERIVYAHLGQIWIEVEVTGKPTAACVESRGINPIYISIQFINALRDLIQKWNSNCASFEDIALPYFVNVGSFHSGVWAGSVPADAKLQIQIGFGDEAPSHIFERIKTLAGDISDLIHVKLGSLNTPSFRSNPDNMLVQYLATAIESRSEGRPVKLVPVTGHADLRHFSPSPAVLYGPGGGKNPHGIDEFYILDHMPVVAHNIIEVAIKWCQQAR